MNQAPEAAQGVFKMAMGILGALGSRCALTSRKKRLFRRHRNFSPGPYAGHSVFSIQSDKQGLMFMADTTNDPRIFAANPDWQVMFDMDGNNGRRNPARSCSTARRRRSFLTFFYHAPFPAVGSIAKKGAGFEFQPLA